MTKENILIAKFMDRNPPNENYRLLWYDQSWNWLMPVVEKIESLGYKTKITTKDEEGHVCYIYISFKHSKWGSHTKSKIEAVYKACIMFIKWYNQNKEDESK